MGTLHGSPIPLHDATAAPNCKTALCCCEVGRECAEPNSLLSITMRQKSPNHSQWEAEATLRWDALPIFSVFLLKKQVGSSRRACAPAWQGLQQTISPADCCAFTSQMGKSLTNPQKFLPVDDFTKVWITPSCKSPKGLLGHFYSSPFSISASSSARTAPGHRARLLPPCTPPVPLPPGQRGAGAVVSQRAGTITITRAVALVPGFAVAVLC